MASQSSPAGSYMDAFDLEKGRTLCLDCGICLQSCPVLSMGEAEAVEEHARLRQGQQTLRVLDECTFCYNCNASCPHDLNPMALILARLQESKQKAGRTIPEYVRYLFTDPEETSVYADIYRDLPPEEAAILDRWAEVPRHDGDVLFIGCIGREVPLTIDSSRALRTLPKYAPRSACCGEIPFRMGDFAGFESTARHTLDLLGSLNADRLVCYCGSCANSYSRLWPQYLGIELPFPVISIWEWLWEKLQAGELEITRRFDTRAAVTDACYGSELGDGFFDAIRGLHAAAGIEVVELVNRRDENLCCGMASLARRFDLRDSMAVAAERIEQVRQCGADRLSCYCPGCLMNLQPAARGHGIEVHYALDDILYALGDDIPVRLEARTDQQSARFIGKLQEHMAARASTAARREPS